MGAVDGDVLDGAVRLRAHLVAGQVLPVAGVVDGAVGLVGGGAGLAGGEAAGGGDLTPLDAPYVVVLQGAAGGLVPFRVVGLGEVVEDVRRDDRAEHGGVAGGGI